MRQLVIIQTNNIRICTIKMLNFMERNIGTCRSLMDHVFAVLEEHAANLESEIQERMKELIEEKKKSDLLLYRMLPKLDSFSAYLPLF